MDTKVAQDGLDEFRLTGREQARLLLVDDNPDLLKLIGIRLRPFNFELRTAESAEDALTILAVWAADLVITDLRLPGMSGMELFSQIQQDNPLLPVIILTAHGTIQDAVQATQAGVVSYLTKPFDGDALVDRIQSALFTSGFTEAQTVSSDEVYYDRRWRGRIVSTSPAMKALLLQVEKLALTNVLVMFEGEAGTGKGELARALHRRSDRSDSPFVEVSCSAYADEVLFAEVFGVSADAQQGIKAQIGKLREANDGTILFRDFDEAAIEFLRSALGAAIERRASTINSNETYPINVRIVASSASMDPADKPSQELWDMGYKLGLTPLQVPPLRERREDIPLITNQYLQDFRDDLETQFSSAALRLLVTAEWPGNIRQLIAVVRQCVRLTSTRIIPEALVSSRIQSPLFQIAPLSTAQREFERGYLIDVLKATRGNVTRAAAIAKRNRTEFHRLLKKHQIEAKTFRSS